MKKYLVAVVDVERLREESSNTDGNKRRDQFFSRLRDDIRKEDEEEVGEKNERDSRNIFRHWY